MGKQDRVLWLFIDGHGSYFSLQRKVNGGENSYWNRNDVFALFVGHDHSNDYVNDFEGFLLGYGRKTGYGCYGPPKGCISNKESECVECSVVVVSSASMRRISRWRPSL